MVEAALTAVGQLLDVSVLLYVVLGVLIGSFFAALPGVGGVVPLAMILPFAITLDIPNAVALLIGISGVSNTANTFPSVLIAVPGSGGSQATIIDGYPMAQRGEAARAFGAAFTASAIGGLVGAFVLLAAIPVMKPLVLSLASPELFVLILWGLTMVGVLSTGAPLKGLLAAVMGLLISTIGHDIKSGVPRFVFGQDFLWEGVEFAILALGIFAIPEVVALAARRRSIAEAAPLGSGTWEGVKDAFRSWVLMLRCSVLGTWIGFIPGLGGSVVDWISYAHAAQTEKNAHTFGQGDVRGVIAPESSNNAKEGGSLIPTLGFGIPGSAGHAILLAAFIALGLSPGPRMLEQGLDTIFFIVAVLVIATILASMLCLALAGSVAKLTFLPYSTTVPLILGIAVLAAYAGSRSLASIGILAAVSVVGILMKWAGWARPPLILGAVLGSQAEGYLWLSMARYGWSWLLRPGVVALLVLLLATMLYPLYRDRRRGRGRSAPASVPQREGEP